MNGKIISFGSGADVLYNKALNYIDEGNILKAESCLKKCIDMDPDNRMYAEELAVMYSRADQYERSTETIARYLLDKGDVSPEICFCMGVNAAAMDNVDKAAELLEQYLDMTDDNGVYAEEADAMLDAIDAYEYPEPEAQTVQIPTLTFDANKMLERGNVHEAIELYERSDEQLPDRPETLLPLAIAYFSCGMPEKGMARLSRLCELHPKNTDALCNYVVFANKTGMKGEEYDKRLAALKKYKGDNIDALRMITYVMCDVGEHRDVLRFAKQLVLASPYDEGIRHILACAYLRTGNKAAAIDEWTTLDTLADGSVVARYCIGKYNKGETDEMPSYAYQLPYKEMMDVYAQAVQCFENGETPDDNVCLFSKWMLRYALNEEKMLFIMRLCTSDDRRISDILRAYLVRDSEQYDLRLFCAGLLKARGTDPFLCVDGELIRYSENGEQMPSVYCEALMLCCTKMRGRYTDYHRTLLKLFTVMMNGRGGEARSAAVLAGAMEYIFTVFASLNVSLAEVARVYDSRPHSIIHRASVILKGIEGETENKNETD